MAAATLTLRFEHPHAPGFRMAIDDLGAGYAGPTSRDADFDFPTRGADGIESVSLVRVVVLAAHSDVRRLAVDLRPGLSLRGACLALEKHGVDLAVDAIESVRLQIRLEGRRRARSRTVSLATPNTSNLNDTARDRIIRGYLKEWGIDASGRPEAMADASVATAAE